MKKELIIILFVLLIFLSACEVTETTTENQENIFEKICPIQTREVYQCERNGEIFYKASPDLTGPTDQPVIYYDSLGERYATCGGNQAWEQEKACSEKIKDIICDISKSICSI